jgi:hypothetical protein
MTSVTLEKEIPQVQGTKGPESQEPKGPEPQAKKDKGQKKSYNDWWFNQSDWGVVNWFKSVGIVTGVVILTAITLPFVILGAFFKTVFMI